MQILTTDAETLEPLEIQLNPFINELEVFGVGLDEILHLHLLKLARAQNEIARRDLVPERFTDLRNSKRQLAPHRSLHAEKVDKDSLRSFRAQIRERGWIVLFRVRAEKRAKHHVEIARLGEVRRTAVRTLPFDLVRAHSRFALTTVNERIVERRFVPRILPHEPVENDRRINPLDVVAFVNQPTPPRLLDVVGKLDAEWTIVPRAAETAVDLRRRKNEASPLGERNNSVDVWRRHFE